MNYPIFGRGKPPSFQAKPLERRGSRHERGYGGKWPKASEAYRESKDWLCEECLRRGIVKTSKLTDHIVPWQKGGSMWSRSNWQALCQDCHNTWKRALEALAEAAGDMFLLDGWCKNPETRPKGYAYIRCEEV